jgi:hypothetical protein
MMCFALFSSKISTVAKLPKLGRSWVLLRRLSFLLLHQLHLVFRPLCLTNFGNQQGLPISRLLTYYLLFQRKLK